MPSGMAITAAIAVAHNGPLDGAQEIVAQLSAVEALPKRCKGSLRRRQQDRVDQAAMHRGGHRSPAAR